MRRRVRNSKGVTPVVATILLVAITVVLVATIWYMASALIPTFAGTPKVTLSTDQTGLKTTEMIVFINSNEWSDTSLSMYSIVIYKNTSVKAMQSIKLHVGLTVNFDGSLFKFLDDGNSKLNVGDKFLLSGLHTSTYYEFFIYYSDTAVGKTQWNT